MWNINTLAIAILIFWKKHFFQARPEDAFTRQFYPKWLTVFTFITVCSLRIKAMIRSTFSFFKHNPTQNLRYWSSVRSCGASANARTNITRELSRNTTLKLCRWSHSHVKSIDEWSAGSRHPLRPPSDEKHGRWRCQHMTYTIHTFTCSFLSWVWFIDTFWFNKA